MSGWVEYPDDMDLNPATIFESGFYETTNNRAELKACIAALRWVKKNHEILRNRLVVIYSDSEYVVNNQWRAYEWRSNKWRKSNGGPVENYQLWKEFISVRGNAGTKVNIEWHKGKSNPVVKAVDRRAKCAAKSPLKKKDYTYRPGRVSRSKIPGRSATMFKANNQRLTIRIYRSDLVSTPGRPEHKIMFEVMSETMIPIDKCFAYVSPEQKSKMRTNRYYLVSFNNDPQYPQVIDVIGEVSRSGKI